MSTPINILISLCFEIFKGPVSIMLIKLPMRAPASKRNVTYQLRKEKNIKCNIYN